MNTTEAIDLVGALAWPVVILALALLFRREVRDRVGAIRKAQLPGGISLELDALEKEVIRTPEVEARRTPSPASAISSDRGILPNDRSYTVAEARVELERALRRLSFTLSRDEEFATRSIEDILLELRASGELSHHVTRQAQEFLRLSAASFAGPLSDDDVVAFHTGRFASRVARELSHTSGVGFNRGLGA